MAIVLWPNGTTDRPAISSGFGPRNLANPRASKFHRGVDMYGFPTVHSIADGEVVYVGWYSGVGWSTVAGFMIWVQHDGFFSRYLHTDPATIRVSAGDRVQAGDPLVDMGWSGLQGPWAEHVHLEVTPGQWHTANHGQVDPVPFIEARLGQTSGGGGVALITSEEDDMITLKNVDTGRLYEVGQEYVKHLDGPDGEHKALADAGLSNYIEVKSWSFDRILSARGIPEGVVNGKGDVLNDLEGKGHQKYGSWSRAQKVERLAYLAQKD